MPPPQLLASMQGATCVYVEGGVFHPVADPDGCVADLELLVQAANRSPRVRHRLLALGEPQLELVGLPERRVRYRLPERFRQLAHQVRVGAVGSQESSNTMSSHDLLYL